MEPFIEVANPPYACVVEEPVVPGNTKPIRNIRAKGYKELPIFFPGDTRRTAYDVLEYTCEKFPDKQFLGTRVGDHYEYQTYKEVRQTMNQLISGHVKLGLAPKDGKMGIFSINRSEWITAEWACHLQSILPIALYSTLGPSSIEYVIKHAEIEHIHVSPQNVGKLLELKDFGPLKVIILWDTKIDGDLKDKLVARGVEVFLWQEIISLGAEFPLEKDCPPESPDLPVTFMYTSGTTDFPKGVVLTHKNLMTMLVNVYNIWNWTDDEKHISYLPLAHSLERAATALMILLGNTIGFYAGDVATLFDDIALFKPTFLCGVPRVWQLVHDKIVKTVEGGGALKRGLFNFALASKNSKFLWDMIIFQKTKAKIGGNVKFILSGSAPLDPSLMNFLRAVFCCVVVQGYGLTETFAGATCQEMRMDTPLGPVGAPFLGNEIKLVDVPEMNYFTKNDPPRGEICIRGGNVFKEYYKNPEETKKVFDADGWFHSGDVGQINPTGDISIIDRIKSIFKLSQGEYVASESTEAALVKIPEIQMIFLYGDSYHPFCVAIVIPDEDALRSLAKTKGIKIPENSNLEAVMKNRELKTAFLQKLNDHGRSCNLTSFSLPKNVLFDSELFSVDNDLLTPTFKLKRVQLKEKYMLKIKELYEEGQISLKK